MSGQVITIAQQKGGSGKTTIAAHLAVALERLYGKRVALVDTDPQGSVGRWFIARSERDGDDAGGMEFRTASAWGAKYEAEKLSKESDYVIVDTPPKMALEGRTAFEVADLVIIPVTPSPVDLWATEPTVEMANSVETKSMVLLNRANPRAKLTAETIDILTQLNTFPIKTMISNRVIFATCMGQGSSVLEDKPSGDAAQEIISMVGEIMATLNAQ